MKIVVLLSGGLDSLACLNRCKEFGDDAYALTIDYGQTHAAEIKAAKTSAEIMGAIEHKVVTCDLTCVCRTPLLGTGNIPTGRTLDEMGAGIAPTFVPGRNALFLSVAYSWAATIGANAIYIGCNKDDAEGYPDCRPEWIAAMQDVLPYQQRNIAICAPLAYSTKAQIVESLSGVDYSHTISCYRPNNDASPCGKCDACILRTYAGA